MDEDDEARDSAPGSPPGRALTAPVAGATPAEAEPRAGGGPLEALVSGAAYALVGLLGGVVGLLGSYAQGWTAGDVPVASILLIAVVFATVRLSGWGMGGRIGATVPAVVWGIVVFVMSTRRPEGDLVVPATLPGYVYIIGGMLAAVLGVARVPAAGPPGQWLLGRAARSRG
ncbi:MULTISPECIES: DUF6113 family protein [Actinomadura]|uniref:Integral membrane protein n=1 Tax=Actinomadura litoris TaxID=2678616 RepID=A0A7K1L5Z4_9ACTN|nr:MULTISPECIES: DUF6113 family protein [Actinomadura]MBT2208617.1 hypothetical protein [Actinomadura sp. NEAU-AAG7]MUN39847.1 hypothetical protein [Actinomadura litoris]